MKQSFNPEYGALMNAQRRDFSIVTHVPVLPPPAKTFQSKLCYQKSDACFYRCVCIEDVWVWEKVTYGPLRQFVLPVCWISVEYVFDDEVNSLKAIIHSIKRYGVYFDDMAEGEHGVSLLTAIRKCNEIIKYTNRVCGVELEYVSEGATLDTDAGDTCEELGTKLNLLIGVLNPHAGAKLEHDKLEARIEALEEGTGSRDSFRLLTADELAEGPQDGVQYFVKEGEEFVAALELEEFESGVDYYVSDLTPAELVVRLSRLENQVATYDQHFTDLNVTIRNLREQVNPLADRIESLVENMESISSTTATIINTYIGWDQRGGSDKTVMERIIDLENGKSATSAEVATLSAKVTELEGTIAEQNSTIAGLVAAQQTKDAAQDAERAGLIEVNNKYKSCFETIGAIEISDDMTFAEVHDAIVAIVNAAKTVNA